MTTSRRWLIVPATAVAALIVWVVAVPIAGVDLDAKTGSRVQHINVVAIIAVSLVVALLATVLRLALGRSMRARADRGARIWVILASVLLVLSLLGPVTAVTASAGWSLAVMHIVVGGLLIVGLRHASPSGNAGAGVDRSAR